MTETPKTSEPLTRTISQNIIPLPRNPKRFAIPLPEPAEHLRPDAPSAIAIRTSYQSATEGHGTPNWLIPGPYRPKSLDEVCRDGNYRKDVPSEHAVAQFDYAGPTSFPYGS